MRTDSKFSGVDDGQWAICAPVRHRPPREAWGGQRGSVVPAGVKRQSSGEGPRIQFSWAPVVPEPQVKETGL